MKRVHFIASDSVLLSVSSTLAFYTTHVQVVISMTARKFKHTPSHCMLSTMLANSLAGVTGNTVAIASLSDRIS